MVVQFLRPANAFFFFLSRVVWCVVFSSIFFATTGSFDPMSSLWPRTAADFAFSQDCEEGPAGFLSRERGFSASEAGPATDSSARAKPVDEVRALMGVPW